MEHTLQSYALESFKKALKYKGMTQVDFSKKINFNKQRVHNYLTGKSELTLSIYELFCDNLGLPLIHIFRNYENQEVPERIVNEIPGNNEYKTNGIIDALKEEIKVYKEIKEMLNEQVVRLKEECDEKDYKIGDLNDKIDELRGMSGANKQTG